MDLCCTALSTPELAVLQTPLLWTLNNRTEETIEHVRLLVAAKSDVNAVVQDAPHDVRSRNV